MEPCPRALLTFGDSSGNPSRSKKGYEDSSHYVVVTATMDTHETQRVDAQVQALKAKYFPGVNPERVSFHGHQLLHKLIQHTGNGPRARQLFKEALGDAAEIARNMNAITNVVVMDKRFPSKRHKTSNTVIMSWAHASDMIRSTILKSQSDTVGITMIDRYDDSTNRIVAKTMARFLELPIDHSSSVVIRTIPRPIFVDAASCNMVQLVDMFAYIVAKGHTSRTPGMLADLHSQLMPHISHTAYVAAE